MAIGPYDIAYFVVFFCIAFLPTYISFKRAHTNKLWVFLLSWAGYWTYGITWIMALALALAGDTDSEKPSPQSPKPFSETPLGAQSATKLSLAENKLDDEKKSAEDEDIEKTPSLQDNTKESNNNRIRREK